MLSRIGFQEHLPEFYISITQIKERDCAFPLLNMPQDYRQDQNDSHVYSQKVRYVYISIFLTEFTSMTYIIYFL